MTGPALPFFLFIFFFFLSYALMNASDSPNVRSISSAIPIAVLIFAGVISLDLGNRSFIELSENRALAFSLIIPALSALLASLLGKNFFLARWRRLSGLIMLSLFLFLVNQAFSHPETSLPVSYEVSRAIYAIWIITASALTFWPYRREKRK